MRVYYYYSACIGIKTPEISVLCDPWFSDGIYDGAWYQFPKLPDPLEKIGPYSHLYISHLHPDHYDPPFLRSYLNRFPNTKLVIAPFKQNFLEKMMRRDGFEPLVVEGFSVGETSVRLFASEMDSADIDSAMVVKRGSESVVNMNDCTFNPALLDRVKGYLPGTPSLLATIYAGAGPYPQTFYDTKSERELLLSKAEEKLQFTLKRYFDTKKALGAKLTLPFAGKYTLGGKLVALNPYRGVCEPWDVAQLDPDAVVLADGGEAYFDTATLRASAVRTQPYSAEAVAAFEKSIADRPMHSDRYFAGLDLSAVPFERLIQSAYRNAQRHSVCANDYWIGLQFAENRWAVMNARKGAEGVVFQDHPPEQTPRYEIRIDRKYLFGLLTGVFHWNNAEVGSQFYSRRVPDIYQAEAYYFLYTFHV